MFGRIGMTELIFIFLVIFILFGAKALPEMARGLAKALKSFKREVHDLQDSLTDDPSEQATAAAAERITDKSNDYDPAVSKRDWRADAETAAAAEEKKEEA